MTTKAHAGLTLKELETMLERAGGPKGLAREAVSDLMSKFDTAVVELLDRNVIARNVHAVTAEQRAKIPILKEV